MSENEKAFLKKFQQQLAGKIKAILFMVSSADYLGAIMQDYHFLSSPLLLFKKWC